MLANVQQENFLSNERNKTKLIQVLIKTLTARGIEASTATGDADGSIVSCGINKAASHSSVVVIGEALTPPEGNVYFMKPGRENVEDRLFSTTQLQELPFSGSILFIHSFTGCDTTCAIFGKSKLSVLKCFKRMPNETKGIADVFYDPTSTPAAVAQAGEEMLLIMYQAPPSERDLNNHRYVSFVKSSTKVKANLASLPPTKGAAEQHSFRVFLQTQQWLGNTLDPQRLGWVRDDSGVLNPLKTTDPPAPDCVLNSIFCRCATGCGGRCGCRKAGIHCSSVCGCQGDCLNSSPFLEENIEEEDDFMGFEDSTEF